jgi:hypothetical protein
MTSEVMAVMTPARDVQTTQEVLMLRFAIVVAVSLAFGALSTIATLQHGYFGIFAVALDSTASAQVFADLVIALTIASGWVWADARERGIPAWPFVASVPLLGSIGVLAYLWVREWPFRSAAPART